MAKYDVFISYSRKDSEFAEKVCSVFDKYKKHYKFEYFFDRSEITSEHDYLERISVAISQSKTMLFLASKNSTGSKFCLKELLFADDESVHIHQYRLDDTEYPKSIKLLLGNHHYREYKNFSIENIVREVLANALKQDIRPLAELDVIPYPPPPKPKNRWKNIVRGFGLGVLLFLAVFGLYKGYHLLTSYMPTSAPYKVGDYYNENGKKGVVFEVSADGQHGKIVSMTQSREMLQWTSNKTELKRLIGADSNSGGAYNMAKVKSVANWQSKYPAFKWCADLGEGWYLPAIEELEKFTLDDAVHDVVNRTLALKGGIKLYNRGVIEFYWSSTESDEQSLTGGFCAWGVRMFFGSTDSYNKGLCNYVRAVSAF